MSGFFASDKFTSRIFWRIAAGIFASILCIEFVLLVYSWSTERNRLLNRLDDTLRVVAFSLDSANPIPQLDNFVEWNNNHSDLTIEAYKVVSPTGQLTQSGMMYDIASRSLALKNSSDNTLFDNETGEYLKYFVLGDNTPDATAWQIWIRVDASYINEYMTAYVYRILGMILLISLFVTGTCIVFLQPILISPLLRLDKLLSSSQSSGMKHAIADSGDLERSDELGRVFRSFDDLRHQLLRAEYENARNTDRLQQFANLGADCFWEIDKHGKLIFAHGDYDSLLPIKYEDMIGKSFRTIAQDLEGLVDNIGSLEKDIQANGVWKGQTSSDIESTKGIVYLAVTGAPIVADNGEVSGYRGTIKDVTMEAELSKDIAYYASHDELTGLRNRREFDKALDQAVAAYLTDGEPVSVAMLDLDRFKHVNDTAGHAAGDAVLCAIASIFRKHISETNALFRLGGDEFGIVLRATDAQQAAVVLENIRKDIDQHEQQWEQQVFSVSATIGLAEASENLNSSGKLKMAADGCCMEAKRGSKNIVNIFEQGQSLSVLDNAEGVWVSRVLDALVNDGFELFKQAIVNLRSLDMATLSDNYEHFELLLRMSDGNGGYWLPEEFLPAAERNALMPQIDEWVVENSLQWLEQQPVVGKSGFLIKINLSAASLGNTGFRNYLLGRVAGRRPHNELICFEITETAAMSNMDNTVELLENLRAEGCTIALDDFGTGYSSLSHIQQLPLDYIKIDGAFIQNISNSKLDQTVVKGVAELARVLQIKTVAEFVDSVQALEFLQQLGIDYAQGYLFSKPEKLQSAVCSTDQQHAA